MRNILSEDGIILLAVITAGTLLSIFGGLDVDNAWGAIIAFVGGVGTKSYIDAKNDSKDED